MPLTKIDHTFESAQLSYAARPNYQPCIKPSFYFNKLPHVSEEHFHRHWETVHADLTVATNAFKSNKVQRYAQIHQGRELKDKVTAFGNSLGFEHLDFDGCSEFWFKGWDDWLDFCRSADYLQSTAPDCKHFMALPVKIFAGYENLIYGEAVPGVGGTDGITPQNNI